jgi:hypothetical protein
MANDWFRAITNENLPFSGAPGQIGGGGSPPTSIQIGPYKSLAPDAPYAAPPAAAPGITDGLPRMGPPPDVQSLPPASLHAAALGQMRANMAAGNYGRALGNSFAAAAATPVDAANWLVQGLQGVKSTTPDFVAGLAGQGPPATVPQTPSAPSATGPTSNGAVLANALPANAFAAPLKFHALTGEHASVADNNAFSAMLKASNGSFAPGSALAPTAPAQIAAMQALDARNAPQAPQAQPFYVGKSNRDLEAMKAYAAPGMPRFLTPVEQVQGRALNSALSMLNQQLAAGKINASQYTNAVRNIGAPLQGVTADMYGNALTGQ